LNGENVVPISHLYVLVYTLDT